MDIFSGIVIFLIGSVLTPVALWFFKPDRIRKEIGLEPKEPYYVKDLTGEYLEQDSAIKNVYKEGRTVWVQKSQVPLMLQSDYEYFFTKTGQQCIHLAKTKMEEDLILMLKP